MATIAYACPNHNGIPCPERYAAVGLDPPKPNQDTDARLAKDDLLHLHADLYRVVRRLELGGHVPPMALAEYRAFGVRPSHVHRTKADHARALRLLMEGLDRAHLPPLGSEDADPGRVAAEFIEAHPPTPAEARAP